jgi:adenine-specific DNA-methyltransferase
MIKYIGSKRVLLPQICAAVAALQPKRGIVLDLFSGTARVGHALKKMGYFVIANDYLRFSYVLARCYVQADRNRWLREAREVIRELEHVKPEPGFFTETYCIKARYFHPKNGARIEAIRNAIARLRLPGDLEAIALTALLEAADRVDSTVGVQMAYLKHWAPRALQDLRLRVPELLCGEGLALCVDALEAAKQVEGDVAYLDPPYNQHSYLGNYHVWETLVRWDQPKVYGVAQKRIDCKTVKSPFNSKQRIRRALQELVNSVRARALVVSFNDEGFLKREEIEQILSQRGYVGVMEIPYRRYVGAKIGIYNPQGRRVGTVSHTTNWEFLFVVSESRAAVDRALSKTAVIFGGNTI